MNLKDITTVLKNARHHRPKRIYCPKCASPNIGLAANYDYLLGSRKYICKECGYTGPIIMELEKDENANEKEHTS